MASAAEKELHVISTGRFDSSLSLSGLFSGENRKPTIILLLTPFILTTYKYYGTKPFYLSQLSQSLVLFNDVEFTAAAFAFFSSFVLLGVIPALVVRFVFKESLASYGVQIGDWRFGIKAFLVLAPIMIAATFPSAAMPDFIAQYPLNKGAGAAPITFVVHAATYLFFYLGWEFYFRGFMQFGLRSALGDWNAILVQTLASCLLHIGKPDAEIYSSILGGIVWGIVAFRARSILFIILIHWLLGVSLDFFICFVR